MAPALMPLTLGPEMAGQAGRIRKGMIQMQDADRLASSVQHVMIATA